jgi:hypothetical protein
MTEKTQIGAGDVEIELDGETVTLECTLGAALALTRAPGGIYGTGSVAERLLRCDIDTMCMVIRAGLGVGPSAIKDLPEKVFRTGLLSMRGSLAIYVGRVANGGRPPEEETADPANEQDPNDAPVPL